MFIKLSPVEYMTDLNVMLAQGYYNLRLKLYRNDLTKIGILIFNALMKVLSENIVGVIKINRHSLRTGKTRQNNGVPHTTLLSKTLR